MVQLTAITRDVSAVIERCELTHLPRVAIDLAAARAEHDAYERCLAELGCRIERLPASDTMPDSVFIEDTAIVFDEVGVIARPGAESRRIETAAVAETLGRHRPLRCIHAPATLDGGDVLVAGRRVFVGATDRTNAAGVEQLRTILAPWGYTVERVASSGCLHLKSAATSIGDGMVLMNPVWTERAAFERFTIIEIDPEEPFAANALRLGDDLIYPSAFPRTRRRLEARGLSVRTVEVSELAKAEGGVTCCSLIVKDG